MISQAGHTNVFESVKTSSCADANKELPPKNDACVISSVSSVASLKLDKNLVEDCLVEKCNDDSVTPKIVENSARMVLFSAENESTDDDDSIEEEMTSDADYDNKVVAVKEIKPVDSSVGEKPPMNYRAFSKLTENSMKIDFDAKFGKDFTLSTWLRRNPKADKNIKEQVICGTDSQSMNRHHYGLYFYRGNLKFLLRKEPENGPVSEQKDKEVFYPSLWEWTLNESLLSDAKWHFYEVKFSYPNAALYIDGVKFAENTTNSDIIDAYELSEASGVGPITSYIGACYHGEKTTKTLKKSLSFLNSNDK